MSAARTYAPLGSRFTSRYGPWAVVTGASDGIGRELARALAASRLSLVLVARREDALRSLADQLESTYGIEARVVAADLESPTGVARVTDATASLEVGLLVAAAGFGTSGAFVEQRIENELSMIEVNCAAVIALTHHFARRFVDRKRGGIVLLSSLVAFQGVPRAATYAATKAFVQTFAEGLRLELATSGVDVLASAPGPVRSGFGKRAEMNMSMALDADTVATATLRALGRQTTVRPGWLSWLLELSLSTLPRWARVRVMALVMRGMTSHHA